MSNNSEKQPLDAPLPDDLSRCESILAGMRLPRSRVRRDELLYNAGWAAAEMHAKSSRSHGIEQKQSFGGNGKLSTLTWSVASAVLAASVAVAITLRMQPAAFTPTDVVVDMPGTDGTEDVVDVTPPETIANTAAKRFSAGRTVGWTASLLIMRDRALLERWDDPMMATDSSFDVPLSDDGDPPRPKTSRDILEELLPTASMKDALESTRRQSGWPWAIRLGDMT